MKWAYIFLTNAFLIVLFISIGSFLGFICADYLDWRAGRKRRIDQKIQRLERFIEQHDHDKANERKGWRP